VPLQAAREWRLTALWLSPPPPSPQLAAPDAEDRVWACAAITNLIQNDPATRRLLQGKNIVGALIARLTDSVEDVVVESCGALRYVPCRRERAGCGCREPPGGAAG
jgi:hypothetical protein